jgi:hypothetical protein
MRTKAIKLVRQTQKKINNFCASLFKLLLNKEIAAGVEFRLARNEKIVNSIWVQ